MENCAICHEEFTDAIQISCKVNEMIVHVQTMHVRKDLYLTSHAGNPVSDLVYTCYICIYIYITLCSIFSARTV